MTLCIITHVPHAQKDGSYFAYSPYVNEMNIWLKYADKVIVAAPLTNFQTSGIHAPYQHKNIEFIPLEGFNKLSFLAVIRSFFFVPVNCLRIFDAMRKGDHIHLRCPGNIGLLGCCMQVLFPKKKKTAKYAGNWDAKAKQPLSYRLQKWLLSSTLLTKNMQVLIYGRWPGQTKNLRPFFTATYSESEKETVLPRVLTNQVRFIFVGSLTSGKQPLYAIGLIEKLRYKGHDVTLSIYGEGTEKAKLQDYITAHNLQNTIVLEGNRDKAGICKIYQQSHFLILPSKSEGWPKVVAEAMFWGCLPIATAVSCVGFMIGYGNRGVLLSETLDQDVSQLEQLLLSQDDYNQKVTEAIEWSRKYTTDIFEQEISKMIQP